MLKMTLPVRDGLNGGFHLSVMGKSGGGNGHNKARLGFDHGPLYNTWVGQVQHGGHSQPKKGAILPSERNSGGVGHWKSSSA